MAAVAVNETYKVSVAKGVNVRKGPGTNYSIIRALKNGTSVTATKKDGVWVMVGTNEWMCTNSGGKLMTLTSSKAVTTNTTQAVKKEQTAAKAEPKAAPKSNLSFVVGTASNYGNAELTSIRNIRAIHGLPYQFLPTADSRLSGNPVEGKPYNDYLSGTQVDGAALGRVYAERIVAKMPLFLITPGKPSFMARFNDQDKSSALSAMVASVTGGNANSALNNITKNGRYYNFEFDYIRYYNFVNPMCRIAAQFLGIGGSVLDNVPLKSFNWGDSGDGKDFTNPRIQAFLNTGLPSCIPFYINSDTQISESFSNSTTQSMMASTINQGSDIGRELNFLLGYSQAALGIDAIAIDGNINNSIENTQEWMNGILSKNNFVEAISKNLVTVAKGGKLMFPEIWSESSFSRSYDVNIKLTTPDCDPLSWYFNICVPLLHLIALVAPQTINENPNGYMSPFLVRAVYKGLFNIDTGIITSMNINKGQEGAWTKEGLPTVVDVSMSIKDLYEAMSITDMTSKGSSTINNTALMDYIANMCGINIFKPEVGRALDIWATQTTNTVKDLPFQIFGKLEQNIMNQLNLMYNNGNIIKRH